MRVDCAHRLYGIGIYIVGTEYRATSNIYSITISCFSSSDTHTNSPPSSYKNANTQSAKILSSILYAGFMCCAVCRINTHTHMAKKSHYVVHGHRVIQYAILIHTMDISKRTKHAFAYKVYRTVSDSHKYHCMHTTIITYRPLCKLLRPPCNATKRQCVNEIFAQMKRGFFIWIERQDLWYYIHIIIMMQGLCISWARCAIDVTVVLARKHTHTQTHRAEPKRHTKLYTTCTQATLHTHTQTLWSDTNKNIHMVLRWYSIYIYFTTIYCVVFIYLSFSLFLFFSFYVSLKHTISTSPSLHPKLALLWRYSHAHDVNMYTLQTAAACATEPPSLNRIACYRAGGRENRMPYDTHKPPSRQHTCTACARKISRIYSNISREVVVVVVAFTLASHVLHRLCDTHKLHTYTYGMCI